MVDTIAVEIFNAGWHECARMAKRDDLQCDIDSPYVEAKRNAAIEALSPQVAGAVDDGFANAVKRLCVAGRTAGGVAGRDAGLCEALDAVEAYLAEALATPGAGVVESLNADQLAIRMLVAAGYVTSDKAGEALTIANGFAPGPLTTPQVAAQVPDAALMKSVRKAMSEIETVKNVTDEHTEALLDTPLLTLTAALRPNASTSGNVVLDGEDEDNHHGN